MVHQCEQIGNYKENISSTKNIGSHKYDVKHFRHWNAESLKTALKVEHECGCKKAGMWGGRKAGNVSENSTFVYVFKHSTLL